jgi:exosortase/archaeosortase family protein
MPPRIIATLVVAATWGAWRWYVERVSAAPEEAASLALTIAFLAVLGFLRRAIPAESRSIPMMRIALQLIAYAAGHALLPPIGRAALAVTATVFTLHVVAFRERPPVAFWGLVALALPVVPSLQFTLGYPMRLLSAALTIVLLRAQGLEVARQGTFLVWRDEIIQFDAPCSGVNMLWAGLLLTLMGCVLYRLAALRAMLAVALCVALSIPCNVLRASSLFYVEAGLVPQGPAWLHEGIGLAAFALSALVMLRVLVRLRDMEVTRCAT